MQLQSSAFIPDLFTTVLLPSLYGAINYLPERQQSFCCLSLPDGQLINNRHVEKVLED
ncbi:hypothetical protein [Nostoc sp. UHCC 0251]|uniref:hypothetical protein n=1 Tax=Nostoc sp. UHCC 0251 TaxID=3110240 RepID=UPI002B1FA1E7|nr:hypothetical protein [Nostoc sp. UHCC 0251]MEA5621609.1 hypothetical protein [Nostoc sp. UHCC 0251]